MSDYEKFGYESFGPLFGPGIEIEIVEFDGNTWTPLAPDGSEVIWEIPPDEPLTRVSPHFDEHGAAHDVFDASQEAVEYADKEDISAVVLVDRSARPMWVGFKEYWEATREKDKPVPPIFFVDPDGFATRNIGTRPEIVGEIVKNDHPYLYEHREEPVMLVDNCIHTGNTVKPILKGLGLAGFEDVRVAVVSEERNGSGIKPDVVLIDRPPVYGCYTFGADDNLVDHNRHNLFSDIGNYKQPKVGRTIRANIRRIIHEGLGEA